MWIVPSLPHDLCQQKQHVKHMCRSALQLIVNVRVHFPRVLGHWGCPYLDMFTRDYVFHFRQNKACNCSASMEHCQRNPSSETILAQSPPKSQAQVVEPHPQQQTHSTFPFTPPIHLLLVLHHVTGMALGVFLWGIGLLARCLMRNQREIPPSSPVRLLLAGQSSASGGLLQSLSPHEMDDFRLDSSFLGVDSPLFSAIVLFKNQPFPQDVWWLSRKKDPWKEWGS